MIDKLLKLVLIPVGIFCTNVFAVTIDNAFKVGIASDTQFYRAVETEDPYKEAGDDPSKSKAYNDRNRDNIDSQGYLSVIINGDLTEFGHPKQLETFKDYVGQFETPVYFGLGNHDYENNVGDCWGGGWLIPESSDMCAYKLVKYFTHEMGERSDVDFDFSGSRGSLAYSWNVDEVHFAQLNNYIDYTVHLKGPISLSMSIVSSYEWLRNDLRNAVDSGSKVIILNMHDIAGSKDTLESIVDEFPVTAIFVGHLHKKLGLDRETINGVPVFHSGASFRKTFLEVEFKSSGLTVRTNKDGVFSHAGDVPYASHSEFRKNSVEREVNLSRSITDIYISPEKDCANGSAQQVNMRPSDFLSGDLNQGSDGKFIYLCQINSGDSSPITNVLLSDSSTPPGGYFSIAALGDLNGDLNEGSGGKFIYIHYNRDRGSIPIADVLISQSSNCPIEYQRAEQRGDINGDLNQEAKGEYIYLCYLRADNHADIPKNRTITIDVSRDVKHVLEAAESPDNWTPNRVVFGFESGDGISLDGVLVEDAEGNSYNLMDWWQTIKLPFNPEGAKLTIPAAQNNRKIITQWWYE